jgi:proline iminopeptidase
MFVSKKHIFMERIIMKTHITATLKISFVLIVGLALLIANLSQSGAQAVPVQSSQERKGRERAMDRIVHIEQGIIRDIPQVPRLCDGMAIRKGKIDIGGCNLYCEQEGEGVPLVLINGGPGGTHHCFHPHFSRAKDFARIIYYDQRGCGLSDYKPDKGYTITQAVDDLELLRKALGTDRWVVLGFSYGGLLGQCYATKYPENLKGLVLVGSSLGFLDLSPSRHQEFISDQERKKINQIWGTPGLSMAQAVYNLHLNGDWKRQNYYRPSLDDLARIALYEWVHDKTFRDSICPSENRVNLEGAFKHCPIPTLILEGQWDMGQSANKPQLLHKNHPNARLVIFSESAHSIFKDEPETFFAELHRFLGGLPEISDEALGRWKKHLVQREKENREKLQNIPEGPMTERERAAIEEFHQVKVSIEKGRKYQDASIPLHSLLSLISACANRDMEAIRRVRVLYSPNKSYDFDSELRDYRSMQIFRAPMPPEDAKEGDIWIIYTKEPDASYLNDALIFILWKGNWMHWGNMGTADAAIQWHLMIEELKERVLPRLKGQ